MTIEQLIRKMDNKELCDYYFANEPNCRTCRNPDGCKEIMMMELEQGRANDPAPTGDEVRAMKTEDLAEFFRQSVKWLKEEI